MSRVINIQTMMKENKELLEKMNKDLILEIPPSKYVFNKQPTYVQLFDTDGDLAYIPFAYSKEIPRPERSSFKSTNYIFKGKLRDEQKIACDENISFLNKTGCSLFSAFPGFGKTCSAIFLASRIKLPTLIICHRIVLIDQWVESIKKFCDNATYQVIESNDKLNTGVDFYIMNAMNIPKNNREFYKGIGFVIVDECHLILAEKISKCMSYIVPRYVLGLSATAYRIKTVDDSFLKPEEINEHRLLLKKSEEQKLNNSEQTKLNNSEQTKLNNFDERIHLQHKKAELNNQQAYIKYKNELKQTSSVLFFYFGTNCVFRKLYRKHHVYKIKSNIRPEVETTMNGKLNWSAIINSISDNEQRNEIIINIILKHKERVFLVLVKRVSQAKYLIDRLEEEKESVTSLIGSNQTFDKSARILVATIGKAGVGFDHSRLNAMILAIDLEQYFIQALGRIFRCQDTGKKEDIPIVFDIVDNFGVLENHFLSRKNIYEEHGGEIFDYTI